MAFGEPFYYEVEDRHGKYGVMLRPPTLEEIMNAAEAFSSLDTVQYTRSVYAKTKGIEENWFKRVESDKSDSVVWVIVPDGQKEPVGVTSLVDFGSPHAMIARTAQSGIVIWDHKWRGRGIASRAHVIRTWYAWARLNLFSVTSSVFTVNEGSYKALLKVGYTLWGVEEATAYLKGEYLNTAHLTWYNPDTANVLFPNGIPEKYLPGIDKAKEVLANAKANVKVLTI